MSTLQMKVYRVRPGARLRESDAAVIGPEIERLAAQNNGGVTAEDVVEAARPETAPLHRYLTWDDALAAHQHRLTEARTLMRAIEVKIVTTTPKDTEPKFEWTRLVHAIPQPRSAEEETSPFNAPNARYVSLTNVWTDDNMAEQVIAQAEAELKAWANRVRQYKLLGRLGRRASHFDDLLVRIDEYFADDPAEGAED